MVEWLRLLLRMLRLVERLRLRLERVLRLIVRLRLRRLERVLRLVERLRLRVLRVLWVLRERLLALRINKVYRWKRMAILSRGRMGSGRLANVLYRHRRGCLEGRSKTRYKHLVASLANRRHRSENEWFSLFGRWREVRRPRVWMRS